MTIQECIASLDAWTAKLRATEARLRLLSLKLSMSREPTILPAWRQKPARRQQPHTMRMRRNFGQPEIDLLRRMVDAPKAFTFAEVMDWKARHRERRKL